MVCNNYLYIWAKTVAKTDEVDGSSFHPLYYHLLDVAAVAECLVQQSLFMDRIAPVFDMRPESLQRLVVFCCALHDIGKCSAHFQSQVPQLWPGVIAPQQFGPLPSRALAQAKHGDITDFYLRQPTDANEPALLTPLMRDLWGAIDPAHEGKLITAIAGHHGEPTKGEPMDTVHLTGLNAPFAEAAKVIAADLADIIIGDMPSQIVRINDASAAALSWFISALLPVADWVGSNQEWFGPVAPGPDARAYWEDFARPRAKAAYAASGLQRASVAPPSPQRTLRHLGDVALSPVQSHAFSCPLREAGPVLLVIEDATGAGKTEAALALAHRLMAASRAGGFYFALPTMATANAMYARLGQSYRAFFEDDSEPSLALAHGKAQHNVDFLASLARMRSRNGGADADAGSYCAGWIGDSRRKALLAQAGAGTIDQVLMAVLPVRYQSLRVHGLASNVLILDEIHSFDPFMLRLIEALLQLHAMLGGSAILMSATLPIATRQRLISAFARGMGCAASKPVAGAYPLVTMLADTGFDETALPLAPQAARRVSVRRIPSVTEAEELAISMAEQGAAVALLRTTVDAALGSFERIKARHPATGLFHARFLLDDRLAIEKEVLARFGKTFSEGRRGYILVATQVIEQSLDIDFDVFITDLAPVDLIIQRSGRLWRHRREGRPVAEPVLNVISPEPDDSDTEKWLDAALPEAKWVYHDVARLWLSAKSLFSAGAIETATLEEEEAAPAHVRRMVEAVYGVEAAAGLPSGLVNAFDRSLGAEMGKGQAGSYVVLEPHKGYIHTKQWESEARASTRLELNPTFPVRLARREQGVLRPLAEDWSVSELRLTRKNAEGLTPPSRAEAAALRPSWAEADDAVRLLILERDSAGGWCSGDGRYRYDAVHGLRIGNEKVGG